MSHEKYFTAGPLDSDTIGPRFDTYEEAKQYAQQQWPHESYQVDGWKADGNHSYTHALIRAKAVK